MTYRYGEPGFDVPSMSVACCIDSEQQDAQSHLAVVAAFQRETTVLSLTLFRIDAGQYGQIYRKRSSSEYNNSKSRLD